MDLDPITFLECYPIMCKKMILENFQNVPYRKISQKSTMSSISEFLKIYKNLKFNPKNLNFLISLHITSVIMRKKNSIFFNFFKFLFGFFWFFGFFFLLLLGLACALAHKLALGLFPPLLFLSEPKPKPKT